MTARKWHGAVECRWTPAASPHAHVVNRRRAQPEVVPPLVPSVCSRGAPQGSLARRCTASGEDPFDNLNLRIARLRRFFVCLTGRDERLDVSHLAIGDDLYKTSVGAHGDLMSSDVGVGGSSSDSFFEGGVSSLGHERDDRILLCAFHQEWKSAPVHRRVSLSSVDPKARTSARAPGKRLLNAGMSAYKDSRCSIAASAATRASRDFFKTIPEVCRTFWHGHV